MTKPVNITLKHRYAKFNSLVWLFLIIVIGSVGRLDVWPSAWGDGRFGGPVAWVSASIMASLTVIFLRKYFREVTNARSLIDDGVLPCPACGYPHDRSFLVCPECGDNLSTRQIYEYWQSQGLKKPFPPLGAFCEQ